MLSISRHKISMVYLTIWNLKKVLVSIVYNIYSVVSLIIEANHKQNSSQIIFDAYFMLG